MKSNMPTIPVIGITTYGRDDRGNFYLPANYIDIVRQAGGLPVMLAPGEQNVRQLLTFLDGLIFAGGGDIEPKHYGGQSHPEVTRVDAERDEFEFELARNIFDWPGPVLGICRGFQLLNVATGAEFIQHVPDRFGEKIAHRTGTGGSIAHQVELDGNSRLARIVNSRRIEVMSKHHQGIANVSDDWQVAARAADGVIEATEHRTHTWMIAVHWHPEEALSDPHQQSLLREFVNTAKELKMKRN